MAVIDNEAQQTVSFTEPIEAPTVAAMPDRCRCGSRDCFALGVDTRLQ